MNQAAQSLNQDRLYKIIQIKEAPQPTVCTPVVLTLDPGVKICLERAELVTESYRQTEGQPWILRRAKALDHLLRNMTLYILDGEQIVGNYASTPDSLSTFPEFSYRWLEQGLDNEFEHTLDDEGKRRLKEINSYWADQTVESAFWRALPDDLKPYVDWSGGVLTSNFWPLGMVIPNYRDRVFPLGFAGMLEDARPYRDKLQRNDPEYRQKADFYGAVQISGQAVIAWVKRYADLARSKAASASGSAKEDYFNIANNCARLATQPPQTFHEALQMFWFCHLLTTQISWCSVGMGQRFDQLFYPFYERDRNRGAITYERAVELFEFLWIKLDDLGQINPLAPSMVQVGGTKFQNATIGGTDQEGNDATNDLSFAALQATMNVRTHQPNLCLRYHDKIDPRLIDKAIDCIGTGIGMPAIFNDNAHAKQLLKNDVHHLECLTDETAELLETHFGIKRLKRLLQIYRLLARGRKASRSLMTTSLNDRVDDVLRNLPYWLVTGGGRTGDWIRRTLSRFEIMDLEAPMRLLRDWASVACVAQGSPSGMIARGSLSTIISA
jgi:formate C-acetyltransferase